MDAVFANICTVLDETKSKIGEGVGASKGLKGRRGRHASSLGDADTTVTGDSAAPPVPPH
jgi:hypothetical protein